MWSAALLALLSSLTQKPIRNIFPHRDHINNKAFASRSRLNALTKQGEWYSCGQVQLTLIYGTFLYLLNLSALQVTNLFLKSNSSLDIFLFPVLLSSVLKGDGL